MFSKSDLNKSTIELVQANVDQNLQITVAIELIQKKKWQTLENLIKEKPSLLEVNLLQQPNMPSLYHSNPTILYYIQTEADNSDGFKKVFHLIMEKSDWTPIDKWFGNTPLTFAVALNCRVVIDMMIAFVLVHNKGLLAEENKIHDDAKNTPLLLAVKNGDQETALKLIPYYEEKDLFSLSKQGNSALHLACYLKMNRIILAIVERAKELGCLDALLNQPNKSKIYRPIHLYTAPFELPIPCIEKGVQICGREEHPYISHFEEEIGKHNFDNKRDSDKIISDEIELLLHPATHRQCPSLEIKVSEMDPESFDKFLQNQIDKKLDLRERKIRYIELLTSHIATMTNPDFRKHLALYFLNSPKHFLKKERDFFRWNDYSNQTFSMHQVVAVLLQGKDKPALIDSSVKIEEHELSRHAQEWFA